MIDRTAAEEELSRAINSMGPYTMNATDYFSGLENRSFTANIAGVAAPKPMGRGRGAVDVSHSRLEEIRLAARINRLEPQNYPLGHLPTTDEILAGDMGAEITAGLRSLGISSGDSALSSRTTIPTVVRENIRIDGNVPVILDGDMFHPRYRTEQDDEDEIVQPSRELKYNPQKPLAEQFPTILEFQDPIPDPDPLQASSESDLNSITLLLISVAFGGPFSYR
uniref:Uncharacterized protein n=1 Tax=Anopheles epiroticus TaxID=199890 RepID=A0A182NZH7_9DIPT